MYDHVRGGFLSQHSCTSSYVSCCKCWKMSGARIWEESGLWAGLVYPRSRNDPMSTFGVLLVVGGGVMVEIFLSGRNHGLASSDSARHNNSNSLNNGCLSTSYLSVLRHLLRHFFHVSCVHSTNYLNNRLHLVNLR